MSKPLFRLNLTAAQVRLLHELTQKVSVTAQDATSMGGIYSQVQAARKYYGLEDAPAAAPQDAA